MAAWRIEGAAAPVHGTTPIIAADFPRGITAATIGADVGTVVLESVPHDLESLTFRGQAEFAVTSGVFKKHLSIREVHCAKRTAVHDCAFESAPRLAVVTAPQQARIDVGYYSFEECVALEAFPFEAAVGIGECAFKGCTALARADLTHADLDAINDYAFEGCARLGDVAFGPNITRIGKHAFKKTLCLGAVVLHRKVRDIGEGAFMHSGATSFTCDGSATLKRGACWRCPRLKRAEVRGNIGIGAFKESALEVFVGNGYQIGRDAFEGCPLRVVDTEAGKIDPNVFKGSPVQSVAMRYDGAAEHVRFAVHPGMFANCSSLRKLTLPARLCAVPDDLCKGCSSLRTIELPECVTDIGAGAFDDCSSLWSVLAPCVRTFTRGSFAHCPKLGLVVAAPGAMAWRPIPQHAYDHHDTFDNVFPHSPGMHARDSDGRGVWPGGMSLPTPPALREALSLRFWSRKVHALCTRSQRQWARYALLVMTRLGLPSVAQLIVLSCIETAELGPQVAVNTRVRVSGGSLNLGWGTVVYIGTVVTHQGERFPNRIGVELDRAPPQFAPGSAKGSFVANRHGAFESPHGFAQGGCGPTRNGAIVDADAVVPW
jgi:hypothetical protein